MIGFKKGRISICGQRWQKAKESLWEQNGLVHMVAIEISGKSVTKCSALCATSTEWTTIMHLSTGIQYLQLSR